MKLLLDLQGAQTESRLRGIGRQVLSLAKAIIARAQHHEVRILLNGRLRDNLDLLLEELEPLLPADHITIFNVPGAVAERNPENIWRAHAAELLREATIAQLRPDIVHVGSLFEGYVDDAVVSVGRMQASHATAVTLHDLIPLIDSARYLAEAGPRQHWLRRAQSLKRADLLVSVSESSKREAVNWLQIPPERIAVIRAGVSPNFRRGASQAAENAAVRDRYELDAPFLFYVGAVDPRKNVALIFEAFARMPDAVRSTHLLAFAGALFDEEIAALRLAAARCGIDTARLRFCKHVTESDLVALYQLCAAFVFPSTHEGFGLPVLEAMACGAPVLASDMSSLPEVVGNQKYLFDPRDVDSLKDKLELLLCDDDARAAAQAWGLARAADFTWDECARRTLDAFEALHASRMASAASVGSLQSNRPIIAPKPRLAYFSPLPPDRSGISDYSVELLRELGRFYDIDCVVTGSGYDDPWINANFVIRELAFFERNAASYDRILYSMGNSHFHSHMLGLMERFPGTVILHDFFLSDLIDWMSNSGIAHYDTFSRELYRTHGVSALVEEKRIGRVAAVETFACNGVVFRSASGVIVHSRWSVERARELFGDSTADHMSVIPLMRALPAHIDRVGARARLGLGEGDLLFCSFGIVTQRKSARELLAAWMLSEIGHKPGARLVFVGDVQNDAYGAALLADVAAAGKAVTVHTTGHAPMALYRDYLAAADIAIQLRNGSRGETSAAVLDCLAAGLPLIVNSHGPAAEIPDTVVVVLPEIIEVAPLAAALDRLANNSDERETLGENGRAYIARLHQPAAIGEAIFNTIERHASEENGLPETALATAVANIVLPIGPDADDFVRVSDVIFRNRPRQGDKQLLYDVTVLSEGDAQTGIQRVVRGILQALVDQPPPGYRIEVVRMEGAVMRYARNYLGRMLGIPSATLPDDVCSAASGDVYLSIDWVPDRLPLVEGWLKEFRRAGGRVVIGVHDLLPLQLPQFFPGYMPHVTQHWFESALRVADQLICVSATTADEVISFGKALREKRGRPITVDYFHNAADLGATMPTRGMPEGAEAILEQIGSRPSFLMVGTVEPRKGHIQVLRGFEKLWDQGLDVGLVIVGKVGWMMSHFEENAAAHPERDRRLLWLRGISDEFLDHLYGASEALILASEGEGFGLPLVEAAKHKTALIARDLPVFREVAGEGAFYFSGNAPDDAAKGVADWLDLKRGGRAPKPDGIKIRTWRETTDDVVRSIFATDHYGEIV